MARLAAVNFIRLLLCGLLSLCLLPGCNRPEPTESTATPPTKPAATNDQAFKVRIQAAQEIASLTARDEAFSKIAQDAAGAGSTATVIKAVQEIASLSQRDQTAAAAALALAKSGQAAGSVEVAKLIASLSLRDDTLKRLAKGE